MRDRPGPYQDLPTDSEVVRRQGLCLRLHLGWSQPHHARRNRRRPLTLDDAGNNPRGFEGRATEHNHFPPLSVRIVRNNVAADPHITVFQALAPQTRNARVIYGVFAELQVVR